MVSLTPELLGNSLIVVAITYVITLLYSIFMTYLSWKQAKVSEQMKEVIAILKEIRDKK